MDNDGLKWGIIHMFIGEYNHTIDDKGRVSIPAKFRQELGGSFVMSKGLDKCLFIFPNEEWTKLEEKITSLPLTDKNARSFSRFLLGGACELEPDKQGRAMIPQNLRQYASINKDVVIIGLSSRIEMWDVDEWNKYANEEYTDIDSIASSMEDLGI